MDAAMREERDRILIRKALKGNRAAMEELLQTYESLIYRTAYAALYSSYDACDVTQEVLLKIYRMLATFRGDCSFSAWVYRITQNTVRDMIRVRGRHQTLSMEMEDPESGETNTLNVADDSIYASPEKMAERTECIESVREALNKLAPEYREIITLRDIEGYSYTEIAEMLSINEGTMKSRLSRARFCLKKFLISANKIDSASSILTESRKE